MSELSKQGVRDFVPQQASDEIEVWEFVRERERRGEREIGRVRERVSERVSE